MEATSVARGNSEFCGKLGQKIASDIVTAIDDGTLPGEWGSIRYDDEGNPSQCNVLIQNGMLKSYLVDRLGSRIMNQPMTGSARRQSYEFAPTSRMTNTFFAPGYDDEEEMIRTMGEGLFAAKMGGGSVNPLTGEFNFSVLEGYWVKDGKIHCPVRGAALIGRGAEVLMKHIGGYPGNYDPSIKGSILVRPPKLFISGHSHILKVKYDKTLDVLHINPGAAGIQGFHKVRTMVRFAVDGGTFKDLEVIELADR